MQISFTAGTGLYSDFNHNLQLFNKLTSGVMFKGQQQGSSHSSCVLPQSHSSSDKSSTLRLPHSGGSGICRKSSTFVTIVNHRKIIIQYSQDNIFSLYLCDCTSGGMGGSGGSFSPHGVLSGSGSGQTKAFFFQIIVSGSLLLSIDFASNN